MAGERITFEIGPIPAASARAWISHALGELGRFRTAGNALPFYLPPEIADVFEKYLLEWRDEAEASDTFFCSCEEEPATVRFLLTYWLNMVSLTPAQREALGLPEPPPEGSLFSRALGRAILGAVARHSDLHPFASFFRRRRSF